MELTKEELDFLVKILREIENEQAKSLLMKITAYQKNNRSENATNDAVTQIQNYRLSLSSLMKEMRQHPHDSPEGDILSKKAEEIIQNITELERQIQGN